jgi:hypothetical protein
MKMLNHQIYDESNSQKDATDSVHHPTINTTCYWKIWLQQLIHDRKEDYSQFLRVSRRHAVIESAVYQIKHNMSTR